PGEPPRDLGLADAGRSDQDDVVGHDLVAQVVIDALPAPAIAQRDRDRSLRGRLPDDVLVQLRDDLPRSQVLQPTAAAIAVLPGRWRGRQIDTGHRFYAPARGASSSTVMLRFVYMQMSAAISSERRAISAALRFDSALNARAAASAKPPPLPIAAMSSSGSITLPSP